MPKPWTVRETRIEARRFAAALLSAQDQPDWVLDAGIPEAHWVTFGDELQRIAARIEATIPKEKED